MTAKLILAVLVLATAGCAQGNRQPPVAARAESPVVIAAVQRQLLAKHFYVAGPVTGRESGDLQSALWFFQHDQNLRTTGRIDRETLLALDLPEMAAQAPSADEVADVRPPPPNAGGGYFGTPLSWQ